jgi:hypothetical protein
MSYICKKPQCCENKGICIHEKILFASLMAVGLFAVIYAAWHIVPLLGQSTT